MVTSWYSEAPAETRILSSVPWMSWVHWEAPQRASPWKAGPGGVGPCRWGGCQWQNWKSTSTHQHRLVTKVTAVLRRTWGPFASDFRIWWRGGKGRCWQERARRWVEFRSLPASAEKVKKFFCLLVCGIAHWREGVDFVHALLLSLASRRSPYLFSCCQLLWSCPLSLCSAYVSCCDFNYLYHFSSP